MFRTSQLFIAELTGDQVFKYSTRDITG